MGEVREIFFDEVREFQPRDAMAEKLALSAGKTAQNFPNDLAGYVIIAVNPKGEWSLSFAVKDEGPIGNNMLAGLAIAAIQRDMICEDVVKQALIRNGLVLPDPEQK